MNEDIRIILLTILIIPVLILSVIYWFKLNFYYKSKIRNLRFSIEIIYNLAKKIDYTYYTGQEYKRLITFIEEVIKDE